MHLLAIVWPDGIKKQAIISALSQCLPRLPENPRNRAAASGTSGSPLPGSERLGCVSWPFVPLVRMGVQFVFTTSSKTVGARSILPAPNAHQSSPGSSETSS